MSWSKALKHCWSCVKRLSKQALLAALIAGFVAPLTSSRLPTIIEQIQSSGELVVISRNGPTTYYEGASGYTGFEYTLARSFAKHIGVNLVVKEVEDLGQMLDQVGQTGHFAAAGLTVTHKREQKVTFAEPYLAVTQSLLYNPTHPRPKSVADLVGKHIVVIGNSSHSERLRELQKTLPDLTWEERNDLEMLDLMEMVHNEKIDYTVLDSNAYDLNRPLYPKAKVAFDISEPQNLAWAFPISDDKSLIHAANNFLTQYKASGALVELKYTVYGHLGEMNYSDALVFAKGVPLEP